MADAKIIDTTKGLKAPSFKSYDVDAQGNTEIESMGLLGDYMQVFLYISSNDAFELFSINSEVMKSAP